jgi:hypothetical protein
MLVFFINQQISNMVPEKMVCGSTNQKQEKMKKAGPPHCPVVHGELPSGPQRTPSQDDLRRHQLQQQMTEKMRQWPKRPKGLPWPPKSVPTKIRNDEGKPATNDGKDETMAEKTKRFAMAAQISTN